MISYMGDDTIIPFVWVKAYEGGIGEKANDLDVDYYALDPVFGIDDIRLNPHFMYIKSNDASSWSETINSEALDLYLMGFSVDYTAENYSAWFTGIYESGTIEQVDGDDLGVAANLVAVGGSLNLDAMSIHAQTFYATGDEDPTDGSANDYYIPKGQVYYWAEIMGQGRINKGVSAGSPGAQVSNITAMNAGVDFHLDKLGLGMDIWTACLLEEDANGETNLGTEIDLYFSFQVLNDLKLEFIAAYLFAGKATGGGDENPIEIGTIMSIQY